MIFLTPYRKWRIRQDAIQDCLKKVEEMHTEYQANDDCVTQRIAMIIVKSRIGDLLEGRP
jgi:hypothetical protein